MAKAISQFNRTIARSLVSIDLYRFLRTQRFIRDGKRRSIRESLVSDLVRSAIVLSVAGMDAYFTNKFIELLVRYLKKKGTTSELVKLLQDAGLDTVQALEMIRMERPYRRVRTLMESYFDRRANQKIDVIDRLFIAYGFKDFCENAQGLKKRKNLVNKVEALVARRHEIVHRGDYNDHGRLRKIDADAFEKRIRDLQLFVEGADELADKCLK